MVGRVPKFWMMKSMLYSHPDQNLSFFKMSTPPFYMCGIKLAGYVMILYQAHRNNPWALAKFLLATRFLLGAIFILFCLKNY